MSILHQFVTETEAAADASENVVSFRDARAKRIQALTEKWTENTIQLGKELKEVRDTFPESKGTNGGSPGRPGWSEWVEKHVGFGLAYVGRLIRIYDTFGGDRPHGSITGGYKLLDYLARPDLPEEGRKEVIERIQAGEVVGAVKAKKIVDEYRPSPKEANKIARETGKPTHARDGNIYLGATEAQAKQSEDRRKLVYAVRDAVKALAEVGCSPEQFLDQALPHQLWNVQEEHLITDALDWLTDLMSAWESRRQ